MPRPLRMILVRTVLGLGMLLPVSAIIFFAVSLLPGDYATEVLGQQATPESVARFRETLGLDTPVAQRYVAWLAHAVQGDLGKSYASHEGGARPVVGIIGERLLNTFFLAGVTASVAIPLAVGLGILIALYRDRWVDRLLNSATLAMISCPEFFLAYILMLSTLGKAEPVLLPRDGGRRYAALGEAAPNCTSGADANAGDHSPI